MNLETGFTPFIKIDHRSKHKIQTVQILEGNLGENLDDLECNDDFR